MPQIRRIVPAYHDSLRTVPLHLPPEMVRVTPEVEPEAAAAPPPQLTYRGGPLLTNVEVFTLFWGLGWQQGALPGLMNNINQFFDFVLTSQLLDQLAEYNTQQYKIGHGQRVGTITIQQPNPRHSVTDNGIRHMLQQEISTNPAIPQPGPNVLYFVYLPPGVAVTQGGTMSCRAFCGYHDSISGQIFYAVMPYPGCTGCIGNLNTLDALTSTSSHELCEAITDAVPGSGWYDDVHGEIGDICAWQTKKLGNYTVQLEWSNKANACI